jgi:hypothetical protein
VLGKEARPVLGVGGHRDAALLLQDVDADARAYLLDGFAAQVDQPGPGVSAGDAQLVAAARMCADASVAEIKPEKVSVGAFVGGWSRVLRGDARQRLQPLPP